MTTGVDCWIEFCKNVLSRPCPPEINQIEDHEERTHMIWWKCKKWAAKILDRVFERYHYLNSFHTPFRYGAPGSVEHQYTDFANHFLQNYSIPCVEVMTHILNEHQRGTFVSERVRFTYGYLAYLFTGRLSCFVFPQYCCFPRSHMESAKTACPRYGSAHSFSLTLPY